MGGLISTEPRPHRQAVRAYRYSEAVGLQVCFLYEQFSSTERIGGFLEILGEQQLRCYLGLYCLLEILPSFLPLTPTNIVKWVSYILRKGSGSMLLPSGRNYFSFDCSTMFKFRNTMKQL